MIALSGIRRTYEVGDRPVHALRGIDLEIARGEYVSIMGPSGSGKSTLLHIIGCLDRPTEGSYRLDGRETARLSEDELSHVRRKQIGFVFQFFYLVGRLTAAENIELPMVFAGVDPAERRERIARALEAVGLAERAGHRPDQLSGGERQRVAIARALVNHPSILLTDEPTGNLDSRNAEEIMALFDQLHAAGQTIIVVTHEVDIARHAARIIHMRDGRILSDLPRAKDAAMLAPSGPAGGAP